MRMQGRMQTAGGSVGGLVGGVTRQQSHPPHPASGGQAVSSHGIESNLEVSVFFTR